MTWNDLPTLTRRTVDQLVEASGLDLRRSDDPRQEDTTVVIPFTGPDGHYEAVVTAAGAGTLRKAA